MKNELISRERIYIIDVLRGFALLGILLLNIIAFAYISAVYINPNLGISSPADFWAWVMIEVTAEGAMRAIFSMLFGASILLFIDRNNGRSALHYKRMFWLLIFGLINGYLFVWPGDILSTYAFAGCIIYFLRNINRKNLAIISAVLLAILSLYTMGINFELRESSNATKNIQAFEEKAVKVPNYLISRSLFWKDVQQDFNPSESKKKQEIKQRTSSYISALEWSAYYYTDILVSALPSLLIWDALVFMIIGMTLYRYEYLQGKYSKRTYLMIAIASAGIGLSVNIFEVWRSVSSNFKLINTFAMFMSTYHIGRLAMAIGWVSLIIFLCKKFKFGSRLAAVGRMALTNYLMHSIICLFIFTGAGFGLLGAFSRLELLVLIALIWAFQLWFSTWWLSYYNYGPAEWLWRFLTYGKAPKLIKNTSA